jgi:hypothetical protein
VYATITAIKTCALNCARPQLRCQHFSRKSFHFKGFGKLSPLAQHGGPGTADVNRPPAIAWATSHGIVAGPGQSLDEYPFASTLEGGPKDWLRVAPAAVSEQLQQSKDLRWFYGRQGFDPFTFLVVLVP